MAKDVWMQRSGFSLCLYRLAHSHPNGNLCNGMQQTCSYRSSCRHECSRMLATGRYSRKNKTPLYHAGKLLLWPFCPDYSRNGTSRCTRRNNACRRSIYSRSPFHVFCRRERRRLPQSLGKKIQYRTYRQSLPPPRTRACLSNPWHPPQWQDGISRIHVHPSGRHERVCAEKIRRELTGSPSEV